MQTVADANGIPAQDLPPIADDPVPIVLREELVRLKRNGSDGRKDVVMCVSLPLCPFLDCDRLNLFT